MLLYIHIPFCRSKCGYCGFNSLTNALAYKDKYLETLKFDLESTLCGIPNLSSIYIGGGTPNTLLPSDYEGIFGILESRIKNDCEISIELNPNALDCGILRDFKALGINRFSIGIQSFNEAKLRLLERDHSPKIAQRFVENAIKCNISVSIDFIYDTALDTEESLKCELESANALGIGHISCYALSIDTNARFSALSYPPIAQNSLCYALQEILSNYGFSQYEVSNFAKTHKSKHNLGYWQYKEYLGVGLGAVSRVGNSRIYRQNDLLSYIKNPLNARVESLNAHDMRVERIFLGLRSEVGVAMDDIVESNKLGILLNSGKCYEKDSTIFANDYFLADELALWLM